MNEDQMGGEEVGTARLGEHGLLSYQRNEGRRW